MDQNQATRRRPRRQRRPFALVVAAVAAGAVVVGIGAASGSLESHPAADTRAVGAATATASLPGQLGDPASATKTAGAPTRGATAPGKLAHNDGSHVPLTAVPKSDPAKGLVYTGLVVAPENDDCAGELKSADGLCTHGPDAAPEGVDIHKTVPPVVPASAPSPTGGSSASPATTPTPNPAGGSSPSPTTTPTPNPTDGSNPSPATTDLPQDVAALKLKRGAVTGSPTPTPSKTPAVTSSPTPTPSKTPAVTSSPTPTPSKAPAGTEVVCDGDGTTGNRVQVLYVHGPGQDRFAEYRDSIKKWAADVDVIFRASAEQTGGNRHVRYVTEANCTADVLDIEVPAAALGTWSGVNNELVAKGFNRRDRKYMEFTDAQVYCGLGNFANDDRAGQDNWSNFGPSYARVDSGCWGGHAAAHELGHNLGAVSNSAPDSSGHSHCTVNWDLMCYPDGSGKPMATKCYDFGDRDRLDCTKDNYFNTNPKPGSYLASHWNVANNQFLIANANALPEVSIRQLTATSVSFGWGKAANAAKYRIVLNGQAGAGIPAGPYPNETTMAGLQPNTDYTLAIEVVDASGKSSEPGRTTSFHTPAG
ncbi:hypothetical protein [Kitasatospora sp. NPDC097643]|uniref:hypothetical protein n=1 Tax=Kitasatospora sp. NPDC097643 TaxID=3157230 RepID=UPI00332893A3